MEAFRYFKVSISPSAIAHVVINRPEKRNAFFALMWEELRIIMNHLSADGDVRVIIISGAGKNFSSGMDFGDSETSELLRNEEKSDTARQAARLQSWIRNIQQCIQAIGACEKPVICVVHSYAFGLALDLVCHTDLRICSEDATFSVMEVDMGMVADLGSLQLLPEVVGNQSWAKEVCFTGRLFSAREALEHGLVSRVCVSREDAMQEAEKVAANIAEKSPVAVRNTKQVLNHARDRYLEDGLRHVAQVNSIVLQSPDVFEALTAKTSKRKPRFEKL